MNKNYVYKSQKISLKILLLFCQRTWHNGQFWNKIAFFIFNFKSLDNQRLWYNKRCRNALVLACEPHTCSPA